MTARWNGVRSARLGAVGQLRLTIEFPYLPANCCSENRLFPAPLFDAEVEQCDQIGMRDLERRVVSATSGRYSMSSSHSIGDTRSPLVEVTRWRPCIISSDVRATVSSGFTRPLTSTGSRLNAAMSKSPVFRGGAA